MSLDEPDPFDELKDQLDGLDFTEGEILNVQLLPDQDLMIKSEAVKQALLHRGEALVANTQEGRDLQSERVALLVEMARRGLR